jgi:hypothetical protein
MAKISSTERVQFDLRPSKQVQRRMIVDALQRLAHAGFQISDYQYTGFGSVYFVDFILLHKLLGIRRMWSVEDKGELRERIVFNRPFNCIKVRIAPASSVIPTLDRDLRHILWLDYDCSLNEENISDILSALRYLPTGSLLLATLDVEPPDVSDLEPRPRTMGPRAWKSYFEAHAGRFLPPNPKVSDFGKSNIPEITARIFDALVKSGLAGRLGVSFEPLFNFHYKDGNLMLTVGGMIASEEDRRKIAGSTLSRRSDDVVYVRRSLLDLPYRIPNLKLTRKERLFLDGTVPHGAAGAPKFHLDERILSEYNEVYRFLPAYAELLI